MTELKTLKDLNSSEINFAEYHKEIMIPKNELKAEAVKRVVSCPCDDINDPCEVCQREIWFNNLTEEDLK